jgi:methionyl-tRNA formyltransferase
MFKVGLFADGPWSHLAFQRLLSRENLELSFVCGRFNTKDVTLKKMCLENQIRFFTSKDINNKEFIEKVEKFNCELFVSMSFDQIFKEDIISIPKFNIINCHAGKLPFYRGRNILNWVLINDEKEFGITVHHVDKGVDTGDIILQKTFNINDKDTYSALLQVAYVECANILDEAIEIFLQSSEIPRIKQKTIHPVGFTCSKRKIGDELIDWSLSSRQIFNLIRAISYPGPLARTFMEGNEVQINKAQLIENSPNYIGIPGAILKNSSNSFDVKTGDSVIKIVEYNSKVNLKVGSRFVSK